MITKEKGIINVSIPQFQRMMNIVHVEDVLLGLNKVREANKNTQDYKKYQIIIFSQSKSLIELTGNLSPEDLLRKMLMFSD